VATYIGINWADQKHDVILRSASEPAKAEHSQIAHEPDALMEWPRRAAATRRWKRQNFGFFGAGVAVH
jgi:hypothetical protein